MGRNSASYARNPENEEKGEEERGKGKKKREKKGNARGWRPIASRSVLREVLSVALVPKPRLESVCLERFLVLIAPHFFSCQGARLQPQGAL